MTGSSGFIGAALVRRLRRDGRPVLGLDRRPAPTTDRVTDLLAPTADLPARLAAAVGVVHLAGLPGVRDDRPGVDRARIRDNVLATAHVLLSCPPSTPAVVASSSSVYGGVGTSGGASWEGDALRPRGRYAVSKVLAERACAARAAAGGRVVVVRPFTVVGEGQRADMALARWLAAAREGRHVEVLGGLDRRRDLTDVRDVVEGLLRALALTRPAVVNVGTGTGHRLSDVLAAVEAVTGAVPRVRMRPAHPDEPAATLADTGRCAALLGFVPRLDLEAVVRRQAADVAVARAARMGSGG